MVFLIVALVLIIGVVIAVVVGKVGADSMGSPVRTSAFELSDNLGAAGPDSVRLDQSFRGYNMTQVDAVLDALFDENAELRERLAHVASEGAHPMSSDARDARA